MVYDADTERAIRDAYLEGVADGYTANRDGFPEETGNIVASIRAMWPKSTAKVRFDAGKPHPSTKGN